MSNVRDNWIRSTLHVYFAEQARHARVDRNETTLKYMRQLRCEAGCYMATTRADYLTLRPHEVSEPHTVSP